MDFPTVPAVGDTVLVEGQNGTFRVIRVHRDPCTVDVELPAGPEEPFVDRRGQGFPLSGLPCGVVRRV